MQTTNSKRELPDQVTDETIEQQLDKLKSADAIDNYCSSVVSLTPFMQQKINEWTNSRQSLRKRAAYKLLNLMAQHDESESDMYFASYLNKIEQEITKEDTCVQERSYSHHWHPQPLAQPDGCGYCKKSRQTL